VSDDGNEWDILKLLDEKGFSELAAKGYSGSPDKQDELNKERIWRRLSQEIPELSAPSSKGRNRRFSLYLITVSALAAALLVGLLSVFVDDEDPMRIKGDSTTHTTPLQLFLYLTDKDGNFEPVEPDEVKPGDLLIFSARSSKSMYASLVKFSGHDNVYQANEPHYLEAGKDWLIGTEHDVYTYQVEADKELLRFCLFGDSSLGAFSNLNESILHGAHRFSSLACINITKQSSW